tara:strand:- start:1384 stop:1671 length:288 start_codon:yes stop_codon:yes gene_type:complete
MTNLREHPEVQILLAEIEVLLLQKEEMLELIEVVTDQIIRMKLDYNRMLSYIENFDDVPVIVKPPTLRLEDIANTVASIEAFMEYEDDLEKLNED